MIRHRWDFRCFSTGAALCVLVSLVFGCTASGPRIVSRRAAPCAALDSLYNHTGFEVPVSLRGRATFDVDQHRLRGKIVFEAKPSGDVAVEYSSTVLLGGQQEDFVFSLSGDTLRLLDRGRGAYYEGESAEAAIRDILEMEFSVRDFMKLVLGERPSCEELTGLRMRRGSDGDWVFTGDTIGGSFRVVFGDHRKIKEIVWPMPLTGGRTDRLRVRYDWVAGEPGATMLRQVVMNLERRQWRCRITGSNI